MDFFKQIHGRLALAFDSVTRSVRYTLDFIFRSVPGLLMNTNHIFLETSFELLKLIAYSETHSLLTVCELSLISQSYRYFIIKYQCRDRTAEETD